MCSTSKIFSAAALLLGCFDASRLLKALPTLISMYVSTPNMRAALAGSKCSNNVDDNLFCISFKCVGLVVVSPDKLQSTALKLSEIMAFVSHYCCTMMTPASKTN